MTRGSRRRIVLALGGACVAAAAIMWLLPDAETAAPHGPATGDPGVTAGAADASDRAEAPVQTTELFASKDPFGPLHDDSPDAGQSVGIGDRGLTLLATSGRSAQIDVDGALFELSEGDTFDRYFKLLEAEAKCAWLLYGDNQFSICGGPDPAQ